MFIIAYSCKWKTYLLSKLLPLIFSPLGLILILLLSFICVKKLKFIYYAVFALVFFSNGIVAQGLLRYLEYPLQRRAIENIDKAYGIVVLSGGRKIPLGNSNIIEWEDPDRFIAGIELYKYGKAKKLIFTGGFNPYNSDLPPEGDIYLEEALQLGIPNKDLLTTSPVLNTYQEAKAVKKLLLEKIPSKNKGIILVTSAFHMKRAKRIFEKEGLFVQPFPVDFKSSKSFNSLFSNPLQWLPSSKSLNTTSFAIRELIGRIIYRIFI